MSSQWNSSRECVCWGVWCETPGVLATYQQKKKAEKATVRKGAEEADFFFDRICSFSVFSILVELHK